MARSSKTSSTKKTSKSPKSLIAKKNPRSNSKSEAPVGWWLSGANPDVYTASIDTRLPHSGTKCGYVRHGPKVLDRSVWCTLMQMMDPGQYASRRVRMSCWVRSKNAQWVQPWMRVDGEGEGVYLSFDNMCERYIEGTTDWTQHSIVLDVPLESTNIAFGVILGGKGEVWLDDVEFEIVSKKIPVTDCRCSPNSKVANLPQNLNFEE